MKINIVMATYNGERFLREQVESIRQQTLTDWQLLIRDDGSTDATPEIIAALCQEDARIRWINPEQRENLGVIASFFQLIKAEAADYYFFADQDDIWLPNKLALTIEKASQYATDIPLMVYTDLKVVDQNLQVIHPSMIRTQSHHANTSLAAELAENTVTGGTSMINQALATLWKSPDQILMHDWYMALVAAAMGQLVYIDQATELYRQHDTNVLGARTWAKRAKNWLQPHKLVSKYWWLIRSSQKQASHLLELPLSTENKALVTAFVNIMDQPLMTRWQTLQKYQLRKNRAFHTLVFRSLIISKFGYRRK